MCLDDEREQASECETLTDQRAEIVRRLDDFLDGINEDGPFDAEVLVEVLFSYAQGIECTEAFKRGVRSGEESALAYPEVTRDLIAARKAKEAPSADRLHVVEQ